MRRSEVRVLPETRKRIRSSAARVGKACARTTLATGYFLESTVVKGPDTSPASKRDRPSRRSAKAELGLIRDDFESGIVRKHRSEPSAYDPLEPTCSHDQVVLFRTRPFPVVFAWKANLLGRSLRKLHRLRSSELRRGDLRWLRKRRPVVKRSVTSLVQGSPGSNPGHVRKIV